MHRIAIDPVGEFTDGRVLRYGKAVQGIAVLSVRILEDLIYFGDRIAVFEGHADMVFGKGQVGPATFGDQ